MLAGAAQARADIAGGADHSLIPRDPDSQIIAYDARGTADYAMPVDAIEEGTDLDPASVLALRGALTRIAYRAARGRAPVRVVEAFEERLHERGFQTVFDCAGSECGDAAFARALDLDAAMFDPPGRDRHYLALISETPAGTVYVSVHADEDARGRTLIQLDVVEAGAEPRRPALLRSDALARELATNGRVALYGLYFDYNQSGLRPDSEPQLSEIAQFLRRRPDLEVLIVAHTNNTQSVEFSAGLTRLRSQAVVAALAGLGIERARMRAVGAGMSAPIATNRSADGRAFNRRVEIVER